MKELLLTNGKSALVDEQDYYRLLKYKWLAINLYSDKFFAKNQKIGMLHKYIIRENPNEEFDVEFINGNTLDCRRENLRKVNSKIKKQNFELIKKSSQLGLFTTPANKNSDNKVHQIISDNISGIFEKIVFEAKYIAPDGRVFNFGTYDTHEEAKENYDKMIKLIPR